MSMYDKNHYNIVISLQLIKINEGKKKENRAYPPEASVNWYILPMLYRKKVTWKSSLILLYQSNAIHKYT